MVHKGPDFSDFVRFRQHTLRTHSTISDALKDVNNSGLIKYLFHYFLISRWLHFLQEYY